MEVFKPDIQGLIVFKPKIFRDDRGYFFENFRTEHLGNQGIDVAFVQENESMSHAGTLRGLHLQAPPYAQDKLIRVIKGSIYDVAVDIRKNSPTFGKHFGIELNEENKWSFLVPKGFAHGFYCLEKQTVVSYKCSDYYHPESEMGIRWNDPTLNINWPSESTIVSEKDQIQPLFNDFDSPF